MIRVSGIVPESIVDGPGIRYTVFTQGCHHDCPGCHNPQTHDANGGYDISIEEILKDIDKNPLLDGITLTGGEPLLQAEKLVPLAKAVKERGLSVVTYSGYTFEEIQNNDAFLKLMKYTDILVDGRYEKDLRSLDLLFRGSSNQRIIDVQSSLKQGKPILYEFDE
ncbi:MAG: Pyruvate formate-lyase 1-activating enzyme [Firmicutes bacterium ADurb.Bin193]|nr:MAG: Pyruvate formate-lyase 1-activating enzyme [Firmicutes bacterium ADurb.Bin193]